MLVNMIVLGGHTLFCSKWCAHYDINVAPSGINPKREKLAIIEVWEQTRLNMSSSFHKTCHDESMHGACLLHKRG
jgi:hypothetical protein